MYILLLALWFIFNGRCTLDVFCFGLVACALVYLFVCKVMGYKPRYDIFIVRMLFPCLGFFGLLVWEILKADWAMIKLILSRKPDVEPRLVYVRPQLHNKIAQVALANCITLTPGTITTQMQNGSFWIHSINGSCAEGLEDSSFVRALQKLERRAEKCRKS
ncbi:MAG: Na+/H+ antiporter subunit E [Clostridia bacterium]|nr:Na+/H+ antiporter subunit E [Clostridia bacterium]